MFNWVDWTIIAVLIYYGYQGWIAGFADLGVNLITFFGSFWLAVQLHTPVGNFLTEKFGLPDTWSTVLGYLIVGVIAELIIAQIIEQFFPRIPKKFVVSKLNKWLGVLVSVLNGLIIIAFVLLVIGALPLRGTVKKDIQASKIGGFLVSMMEKYGGPKLTSTMLVVKQEAIKFTTIEPDSNKSVALDVHPKEKDLKVDDYAERQMLELVNAEREKAGLRKFTVDVRIVTVARDHSRDMFTRGYFAHVTPDGKTPANRFEDAGISYRAMGENLAYAPDVKTAHEGLMNSPGHRKNILDPAFNHIGIGIITTDSFGMMFTQNFMN